MWIWVIIHRKQTYVHRRQQSQNMSQQQVHRQQQRISMGIPTTTIMGAIQPGRPLQSPYLPLRPIPTIQSIPTATSTVSQALLDWLRSPSSNSFWHLLHSLSTSLFSSSTNPFAQLLLYFTSHGDKTFLENFTSHPLFVSIFSKFLEIYLIILHSA